MKRILSLPAAEIANLVRAVRDDPDPRAPDDLSERFARVAWSCLAEPGDAVAGTAIAAMGAEAALNPLVEGGGVAGLAAAWRESGAAVPDAGELAAAVDRWLPRLRSETVTLALRQAARFGARLVVPGDPAWPEGLDDLGDHAPHVLWVRGRLSVVARGAESIALVGARAATGYGEHVAVEAAAGLVDRGYAIVSGAAYGIDGAAHRAALASDGDTVAVLAGGLDRFYPSGHESLLERIVDRGAAVAEVPPGTAPTRWRFLQRNRLIAAMSAATVVVEAGWRSGSLNTAGHAAALGRPLGAVPGPVTSSTSAGCHRLLREYDAVCVTTADEMAELAPIDRGPGRTGPGSSDAASGTGDGASAAQAADDPIRTRVLDALSVRSPRSVELVARASGLAIERVRAELGMLELEGRVRADVSGWIRRGARAALPPSDTVPIRR